MSPDDVLRNEMSECVQRLAWPCWPGAKIKHLYSKVADTTGLDYGQVKRLWQKERKVIPGTIVDHLRKKVAEHEANLDRELVEFRKQQAKMFPLTSRSVAPGSVASSTSQGDPPSDAVG